MLKIRNVIADDLHDLLAIEQACFSKEEAATKEAFVKRIAMIPDSFFVAEESGSIIGFVNGPVIKSLYITDDLFSDITTNPSTGGHQSVLGLAVSPAFQKRGVAAELLTCLENEARAKKRETITLTCKENLIHFYERFGYVNKGKSSSTHGGVIWYNMIKGLE